MLNSKEKKDLMKIFTIKFLSFSFFSILTKKEQETLVKETYELSKKYLSLVKRPSEHLNTKKVFLIFM